MNSDDLQCCLCREPFGINSQPRMMPHCQHSACTSCLKKVISVKTITNIKCLICGHQENLQEADLQYFPKNISLTRMVKEMVEINAFQSHEKTSKNSIEIHWDNQPQSLRCKIHNKELEIICITDKERLCPHCALFGKHKNHSFKTLTEVSTQMRERKELFESFRKRKQVIDARLASKEFKQGLVEKIGAEKQRVIKQIKQKFFSLYENIRLAEKQAYEDVIKNFKIIYQKILGLIKQQNDCQVRFKQWQALCTQLFGQVESKRTMQQKSALFYGGPLEHCKEGENFLYQIEQKVESNLFVIQRLITSIKIVENASLANSIFNYLNIFAETEDIELITQAKQEIIQYKHGKEEPLKMEIQFSSAESFHFVKNQSLGSPKSGLLNNMQKRLSTPSKKSGSKQKKLNRTSERRNVERPHELEKNTSNVQKMVEQFCKHENMETLDLTSYNLTDGQIQNVLKYLKPIKKIKGLKLIKNKLTNEGLSRIIELIPTVTNLNLSFNLLGDESLAVILSNKQQVPLLRIINISNNKINERKAKATVEELKRQGIIVTI